jgi:hypothetical protein
MVKDIVAEKAAKKAAKDALVKSADALNKSLNTAGIRPQDKVDYTDETGKTYPGIDNRATQWYANAIKGNIDMNEYRNILDDVETSKRRIKTHNDLASAALDKKIDPTIDDVHVLDKVNLPIQYPGSKKIDNSEYTLADMPAFIPELDENKWDKSIFGNTQPTKVVKQVPITGTDRYDLVRGYSPQEMASFANTAAGLVNVDKSAEKQFTKQLRDPNFVASRTQALQSVFGKDAVVNSPQTAAAGDAIVRANQKAKTESFQKDNWKEKALFGYNLSKAGGMSDDNYLNKIVDDMYDNAPQVPQYTTMNGQKYIGRYVDVPLDIRDKYKFTKGDIDVVPDVFLLTDDKKTIVPVFYKKDKNNIPLKTDSGAYQVDRNINSKPINISNYKVNLGSILLGTKTRAREVADMEAKPSPAYSSESVVQKRSAGGTGITAYDAKTQEKIKSFMKANNLSESEAIPVLQKQGLIKTY